MSLIHALSKSNRPLLAGWLLAMLCAPPALAADNAALAGEIDAALSRLAGRDALVATTLERPARTRYELGAVIDVRRTDPEGLAVLAVTPGGAADRMGLRKGDRLLRLNGAQVARAGQPARALAGAIASGNGRVALHIGRGTRTLALSGSADRIALPAYTLRIAGSDGVAAPKSPTGCGRVSTFDAMPRSQRLFPVIVIAIDGRTPPTQGESVRLDAGTHRLLLAERIDVDRFNATELKRRDLLGRDRYKSIDVDVEAGTTYQLAAELHEPPQRRMAGGAYWSPKVWRTSRETCR